MSFSMVTLISSGVWRAANGWLGLPRGRPRRGLQLELDTPLAIELKAERLIHESEADPVVTVLRRDVVQRIGFKPISISRVHRAIFEGDDINRRRIVIVRDRRPHRLRMRRNRGLV